MRRFLSWVGLIFCLIGLLFSSAIVAHLVISPPRGPVAIVAVVVMIISAILLLPPILGVCALLRPVGLLGATSDRKKSKRSISEEKVVRTADLVGPIDQPRRNFGEGFQPAPQQTSPTSDVKKARRSYAALITVGAIATGVGAAIGIPFVVQFGLLAIVMGTVSLFRGRRKPGDTANPLFIKRRAVRYLVALVLLGVSVFFQILAVGAPYDVTPANRLAAVAYTSPPGCDTAQVQKYIRLPTTCVTRSNTISNSAAIGLRKHHNNDFWIRIGNDAVDAQCAWRDCIVRYVGKNKFYQR